MELIIDGLIITSEKELHAFIKKSLLLPDWYVKNLDALWDVLTTMIETPLTIKWRNFEISKHRIANFEKIIALLKDVEIEYKRYGEEGAFKLILE
jgi:ribonuclease inhibitor